jgi:hypothetical protein
VGREIERPRSAIGWRGGLAGGGRGSIVFGGGGRDKREDVDNQNMNGIEACSVADKSMLFSMRTHK